MGSTREIRKTSSAPELATSYQSSNDTGNFPGFTNIIETILDNEDIANWHEKANAGGLYECEE